VVVEVAAVEGGVDGPLVVVVVVVVEVDVVGAPVSLSSSAGAVVVVVVGDGSGVVVVVVVVGSGGSVVDVVSVSVDGSAVSATAEAAGIQTRAVKIVVRPRARRTRRTWTTSGRDGGLSPIEMFQNDDIGDGAGPGIPAGMRSPVGNIRA
jgi:hypothetical protein